MRQFLRYAHISILALLVSYLTACSKIQEPIKIEGFAQGTTYHFTFAPSNKNGQEYDAEYKKIQQDVIAELQRIDASISNYRNDSIIEIFNAQIDTEPHEVNNEVVKLIEQARGVSKASKGCYDLTIKPLFDLWGFKKDIFNLPSDDALQQTLQLIGMDNLVTVDATHLQKKIPNLRVDLSSIGQGYSVGRIADVLEKHSITNYIVEIGGELKTRGKKPDGNPWRIAVEKPISNIKKVEKIAVFKSGEPMSLTSSGTYNHYFDSNGKRFSHILDARTGKPIEHNTVAVSVFNPDPTTADAWDTPLLCMGTEEGLKVANENNIAALFIDQDGDKLIETESQALINLKAVILEAANDQ
jgi:thiamine biosynthesis lipoprotein